jgi:glycerophosphoryl diester phosphodiesterase
MSERPLVLGHRGARREQPENTLPAFRRALELGADGVELDVRLNQDVTVFVFHDDRLDRLTDGQGPIEHTSSHVLRELDAWKSLGPAFAGTPLCTLSEALEVLKPARLVNIELKGPFQHRFHELMPVLPPESSRVPWRQAAQRNPGPILPRMSGETEYEPSFWLQVGLAERVLDAVYEADMADRVVLSCFDPAHLFQLRRLDDRIPLAYLFGFRPFRPIPWQMAEELRLEALHPFRWAVSAGLVRQAHARGLRVRVWTVNSPGEARRLAHWGVDGIITDLPGEVRKWIA